MIWILSVIALTSFTYLFLFKPFRYWSDRKIPQYDVWSLWKRIFQAFLQVKSTAIRFQEVYNAFPNLRYVGIYQFFKPAILLRDPDLIKQITVKDFDHFVDHNQIVLNDSLWEKNLFSLKGDKWRDMRSTLSPSFTSSKMKGMFTLIRDCAEQFVKYFDKGDACTRNIEMKDTFSRFTNDVIASIAFGVTCDSLKDRENEFYMMGKAALNFNGLKFILCFMAPRLAKFLGIEIFSNKVKCFFRRTIKDNIAIREREGIIRLDMIHLLMEARKGRVKHDGSSDSGLSVIEEETIVHEEVRQKYQLTDDDIIAQAFVFFLGGFDTVSWAISFMAYELAVNPDVQQRLQIEVDETLNDCGGSLTYEAFMKMKYMDMTISETLRKWPVAPAIDRLCVKPYTIQPVNDGEYPVHLNVGDVVLLSVYGIHRDPKFYPDPERFDPDRFNDDNKTNIKPYSYLAFGAGPRSCIGNRFAFLEIKIVFFYILTKFNITVTDKTIIPLKLGKDLVNLSSEGGVWLEFKHRKLTTSS